MLLPFVHDESLYAHKALMVWHASLCEFVLNRLVELVNSGIFFTRGFKEARVKKVANDILDFTGIAVSNLQLSTTPRIGGLFFI
jgi:hypothetical protein